MLGFIHVELSVTLNLEFLVNSASTGALGHVICI